MSMRDAISTGLNQAVENNFPIVSNTQNWWEDFITDAINQILQALADAGHDTDATVSVLPQDTPVVHLSVADLIAQAATEALNRDNDAEADCIRSGAHRLDADDDGYCNHCGSQGPFDDDGSCVLTGAEGENPDDCTTHEHQGSTPDPYANHVVYQIPAGDDLRQVRNLVRAIAPLFGAAVYYRYEPDTGARVMDVASPTDTKDVFTATVTGLAAACRQHITEQHTYPRAAATLYATVGAMLAADLNDSTEFTSRVGELATSRAMLRANADAPARTLTYVAAADPESEISGAARILLIENTQG